jgi:peptidoglycan biosynthesis protein MviN/MurJ (putative lipid II flippase)
MATNQTDVVSPVLEANLKPISYYQPKQQKSPVVFSIWALLVLFLADKLGFITFHTHAILRGSDNALNGALSGWLCHLALLGLIGCGL